MQLNDLNNAAKKLDKEKKAYTQLVSDFNGRVPSMSQEEYNAAKKILKIRQSQQVLKLTL